MMESNLGCASDWRDLAAELDLWLDAGRSATIWWRDDDAVDATSELETLLKCAGPIPIALAVIPSRATDNLAQRLKDVSSVGVLQHGWGHADHTNGFNNEYPPFRSGTDVASELAHGQDMLADMFGTQLVSAFAPPWHGFDSKFLPLLPQHGISYISRKGPRPGPYASDGLMQVNAHVAPIRWTDKPSFGPPNEYLTQILDHLRGRRTGMYDVCEPTGLLTHHLVQNEDSYDFIARFIDLVSSHPAARWLSPSEVFSIPEIVSREAEANGHRAASLALEV